MGRANVEGNRRGRGERARSRRRARTPHISRRRAPTPRAPLLCVALRRRILADSQDRCAAMVRRRFPERGLGAQHADACDAAWARSAALVAGSAGAAALAAGEVRVISKGGKCRRTGGGGAFESPGGACVRACPLVCLRASRVRGHPLNNGCESAVGAS